MMNFAPLIRSARQKAGLTQDELAILIGAGTRAVWQLEQGTGTLKTLIPALSVLRIAIAGLPPGPDLGSRVKAARLKRGWSLQELSSRCGLSVPTIRGLERNAGRVISLEVAIRALAPHARERQRPSRHERREPEIVKERSDIALFVNADCLEFMRAMESASVNLVVTSPPYNAQKAYEDDLSLEDYTRFAEAWVSCIPRLLTTNGALWLNLGYTKLSTTQALPLTYLYYPILRNRGLHLVQEVVWHYEGGLSYTGRFAHRTERWMWLVRDPTNFVFHLDDVRDPTLNRTADERNSPFGKNPTDYWYFDRVVGGRGAGREKSLHPCQLPVPMLSRIIRACSNPGDVVLDPFGGAGSTAVAAVQNGRGFVSIERDPSYHEIAHKRLSGEVKPFAGVGNS